MPMINGIRLPYGNESMLGQNYGLLGEMRANSPTGGRLGAIPSGINPAAAGSPLGDAVAALRAKSVAATPPAAPVGPGRMPPMMSPPPMINLDGGQPTPGKTYSLILAVSLEAAARSSPTGPAAARPH